MTVDYVQQRLWIDKAFLGMYSSLVGIGYTPLDQWVQSIVLAISRIVNNLDSFR